MAVVTPQDKSGYKLSTEDSGQGSKGPTSCSGYHKAWNRINKIYLEIMKSETVVIATTLPTTKPNPDVFPEQCNIISVYNVVNVVTWILMGPILVLILALKGCLGKYTQGHLLTHQNWAFLDRFCFISLDGEFRYDIEYAEDSGPVNLLLYYDTEEQWPSVYKTNKTCEEKESILSINRSQIVNLTTSFSDSGCKRVESQSTSQGTVKGSAIIMCSRSRRFLTARERWWFIAVSNCGSKKGLNIRYKFLMTNGPPGDYWHEHMSADELYILPILVAYTIAYLFLIMAVVVCSVELKARQFLHATYKLFIVSVILQELGILLQTISFGRYATHGIGYTRVKNFGRLAESGSETAFLVLLLLLAKGYTVTRGRLRLGSSVKLTIFTCLYTVVTLCLFVYEREYFDPGDVLYLYESPAGYGVIILRIVAWWMFIYSTVFTLKHYPEKASFYYPFNLIGTLWFVSGPAFILAANSLIDKWVRESVVCGVMHFIAFAGHVLFLVLTMPSNANKNFPYHVRTNQIGIMEVAGVDGNNAINNFGHHNYEPQARSVPMDLFTVSKTLELETGHILDYQSNTYPHLSGYTQTILLPFTIRDGPDSSDGEAGASTSSSPEEQRPGGLEGSKSAQLPRSIYAKPNRLTASAGEPRDFAPSAPLEGEIMANRQGSASTISAATAEKYRQDEEEDGRPTYYSVDRPAYHDMSVQKLTDMFVPQSLKQPD